MSKYELQLDREVVPYTVRRSRRAKNILLHVDVDGTIELVVPMRVSLHQATHFLESRRRWIAQQRTRQLQRHRQTPVISLISGSRLPVFGTLYTLVVEHDSVRKKSSTRETDATLYVHISHVEKLIPAVEKWYRTKARIYFEEAVHARTKDNSIHIRINAAMTQWGSCNKKKRMLSFNWRLALAPPEVADYVVTHEVAHLTHSNHSRSFWRLVQKLDPTFEEKRQWLRAHGHKIPRLT